LHGVFSTNNRTINEENFIWKCCQVNRINQFYALVGAAAARELVQLLLAGRVRRPHPFHMTSQREENQEEEETWIAVVGARPQDKEWRVNEDRDGCNAIPLVDVRRYVVLPLLGSGRKRENERAPRHGTAEMTDRLAGSATTAAGGYTLSSREAAPTVFALRRAIAD